ncbi:2-amino-4-hydroxy-6-hydroxymethyldihydropteridine diphosphokinase [Luteirhabdus pelagi]|uniref:2-amino-4-hydroxy-6- hydroxymethyldihydropteridine diphosphokinase n=1 Tax=Luteirhabdus pelagi TaxID=2792783 RepID=UPI001F32D389|nr:2-amino-4-hydroxy-6-hydroxymethyldihydropteridine diphosphokinase [Luteirhabdus pelagi]
MGSNLGNRFEHLQKAIDSLFEEVGGIRKISAVYETPALGFEGDPFLNCAVWMQTVLEPEAVLAKILQIEKRIGRERMATEGYSSRPIDIDILLIEEEVISTKTLTVPHPEMQHRKFVLQPLAELDSQLKHPVFHKKIVKLLAETADTSVLEKQGKWLRNPNRDYDLGKLSYVAIEGNIGAGKTSLATQISNDFNAKLILERFKDNPFLPKFYEDPERYSFPLEMSFLADRYQQLLDDIKQFDLFQEVVVADYDAYKSLIFAKVTLAEEEYELYKKLFHLMHKELPKPDVYVYLYQNTERLLENIKKRGREYEQSIEAEYLQKINQGYLEFIKTQHNHTIKIIDISELDFVENRKDYLKVLKQILNSEQ